MVGKFIAAETLSLVLDVIPGAEFISDRSELYITAENVLTAGQLVKTNSSLQFDHLSNLTAVDYPDYIEVVYHLYSHALKHKLVMKVKLAKQEEELPQTPSVVLLWPTAEFQEREVYDLFGVEFNGHPDLRRILLPDDFVGYPLRKDFQLPSQRERNVNQC